MSRELAMFVNGCESLERCSFSTVADEVRLVRTKYSTLTVFKKLLLRSESGNILLFF